MRGLMILSICIFSSTVFGLDFQRGDNGNVEPYIFDLKGKKGLFICLHGSGGSADGFLKDKEKRGYIEDMQRAGYSFLCPTSSNRKTKQWDPRLFYFNKDVRDIDKLLDRLGVSRRMKIYLVGHSNGGGFATRFSVFSARSSQIKGVHYANSAGITKILQNNVYTHPTFYAYAKCDPMADAEKVESNMRILRRRIGWRNVSSVKTDDLVYLRRLEHCHKFVNVSSNVRYFFG